MDDQMMSATGSEESIAERCCNVVRKVTAKGVSATWERCKEGRGGTKRRAELENIEL